ncbi:RING finger protein 214 [Synchiropus splendidus]|uniref:RING finger protein 214 n=1 Tax=Synchiropus splendidus TaxID=270530 RepID=UPI00237DD8F1|nr:RING finger protein 214 [Synchiropus splendidus]
MEASCGAPVWASAGALEYPGREEDQEVGELLTHITLEGTAMYPTPTAPDLQMTAQGVQTDLSTVEATVNTDPDWEKQVMLLLEQSNELALQHNELMRKQSKEGDDHQTQVLQLQEKKLEATRQHQALLEKVDSVRVKLQLNNSKSTRKNFLTKKQELNSEKCQVEEERNRLATELEESNRKLEQLTEEQCEEYQVWQEELMQLTEVAKQLKKEAQEAELQALKDEIIAVEKKRDAAMACMESWLKELRDYLNNLRVDFPQQYHQERSSWEKKEDVVRKNMDELQNRYREVLRQLREGRELDSLPRINMPELPQVPTADLIFNQLTQSIPPSAPAPQPIPPKGQANYFHPAPRFQPPPHHQSVPQFQPPTVTPSLPHSRATPPPTHTPSAPAMPALHRAPAAAPSPPPSSAASTLEKILEKLAAHYPQCSRAQLTSLLQQVKVSRKSLAGLSIDEVVDQCLKRAAKDSSFVSIGRPAAAAAALGPIQRPPSLDRHQGAAGRKLCLMCQNFVDPESRHPLSCSHTVHRDCIKTWLQSSRNNSCPFCLAK